MPASPTSLGPSVLVWGSPDSMPRRPRTPDEHRPRAGLALPCNSRAWASPWTVGRLANFSYGMTHVEEGVVRSRVAWMLPACYRSTGNRCWLGIGLAKPNPKPYPNPNRMLQVDRQPVLVRVRVS